MLSWPDTENRSSFICQMCIEGPLCVRHSADTGELKPTNEPTNLKTLFSQREVTALSFIAF